MAPISTTAKLETSCPLPSVSPQSDTDQKISCLSNNRFTRIAIAVGIGTALAITATAVTFAVAATLPFWAPIALVVGCIALSILSVESYHWVATQIEIQALTKELEKAHDNGHIFSRSPYHPLKTKENREALQKTLKDAPQHAYTLFRALESLGAKGILTPEIRKILVENPESISSLLMGLSLLHTVSDDYVKKNQQLLFDNPTLAEPYARALICRSAIASLNLKTTFKELIKNPGNTAFFTKSLIHLKIAGILDQANYAALIDARENIEPLATGIRILSRHSLLDQSRFDDLLQNAKTLPKGVDILHRQLLEVSEEDYDVLMESPENSESLAYSLCILHQIRSMKPEKRKTLSQEILIPNIKHAQSLALAIVALDKQFLLTEENCNLLIQKPEEAAYIPKGLSIWAECFLQKPEPSDFFASIKYKKKRRAPRSGICSLEKREPYDGKEPG